MDANGTYQKAVIEPSLLEYALWFILVLVAVGAGVFLLKKLADWVESTDPDYISSRDDSDD